jgi:5'-nucleotidase/UDP-sugar diphosphatase
MIRRHACWLALVVVLGVVAGGVSWAAALGKTTVALDTEGVRLRESTLGDLVADAVRAQAGADAALVQAGMFLDGSIPPGEMTSEQLRALLFAPDEPLVLVEMPGSTLQAALERGLSYLPRRAPAFLQVSGLAVTFRSSAAATQRIESVQVGGAALSPEKTYRVAMPRSLAQGGALGYFRIFDGLQPQQTGATLSEAVFRYVQASGTITIRPGARLQDLTPPKT